MVVKGYGNAGGCNCGPNGAAPRYGQLPDTLGAGAGGATAARSDFTTGITIGVSVWFIARMLERVFFKR